MITARLHRPLLLGLVLLSSIVPMSAQQYTIKFATLATEGSTWMNVMKEFDQAIRKESGGKLGFKMYSGGVQGDEKDVLRKIKLGQLHSAGITGVGMTTIASKVRILDSPFLFKSYDEVDHILKTYDHEFQQAFEEGGYINLGWAEVGWVYIYTNTPVRVPEDLRKVKMWMWEGDPIAEAIFRQISIHPIPLAITDVLTSLQTKLVDGVYAPPLGAIVLQWFTRVKYMLNTPLADASGAVVISKKKFDEIPSDLQEILIRNGRLYLQKLTRLSREDNAKSIETLKKNGVTVIDPNSQAALDSYAQLGRDARKRLAGKLFSEDLLRRLEKSLADYRTSNGTKSK
ncbi:MAG TPA: TRAP transporter substrate-binding protein DctP [Bacteroidota bacterium]|jgi:TRAP-type C4-dicarboxylate transport system substrate-binding protein|nr:TRAP transporter substrate-binding protein DctP [Bacteroidota bacterium]